MTAGDADSVRDAFDRLSATSLRHRFFSPAPRLTPGVAADLIRLTGHVLLDNAAGQALLVRSRAACWISEPGVMAFEIPLGRRTVSPAIAARRTVGLAS